MNGFIAFKCALMNCVKLCVVLCVKSRGELYVKSCKLYVKSCEMYVKPCVELYVKSCGEPYVKECPKEITQHFTHKSRLFIRHRLDLLRERCC